MYDRNHKTCARFLPEIFEARNDTPAANVNTVTFPDGKKLFAGSSNEKAETK